MPRRDYVGTGRVGRCRDVFCETWASASTLLGFTLPTCAYCEAALGQAQNLAEKNRAFESIAASCRFRAARPIGGDLFAYLTRAVQRARRFLQ